MPEGLHRTDLDVVVVDGFTYLRHETRLNGLQVLGLYMEAGARGWSLSTDEASIRFQQGPDGIHYTLIPVVSVAAAVAV